MSPAELYEQLVAAHEQVGLGLARTSPTDELALRELAAALREMADVADKLAAEAGK